MEDQLTSVNILGVRIDKVTMKQVVELVRKWVKGQGRYYIVTPNPEFIMLAQKDWEFKKILNNADLAIPDGSGLKIASDIESIIPGVDFLERLCKEASVWSSTIGLLGGKDGVAEKTSECLQKKYPKLKVTFSSSGGSINNQGENDKANNFTIPPTDILFVAFGQGKQEKWIAQNLHKLPVKVMMGVGGSFDEIAGIVPKPPKLVSDLGLKWLFRLITEPWRFKRQLQLIKFLYLVLTK